MWCTCSTHLSSNVVWQPAKQRFWQLRARSCKSFIGKIYDSDERIWKYNFAFLQSFCQSHLPNVHLPVNKSAVSSLGMERKKLKICVKCLRRQHNGKTVHFTSSKCRVTPANIFNPTSHRKAMQTKAQRNSATGVKNKRHVADAIFFCRRREHLELCSLEQIELRQNKSKWRNPKLFHNGTHRSSGKVWRQLYDLDETVV